ncbi:large subunit ribosomal protein L4e [Pancytospora philotis]|nr:large subunit ribosomal protein L4e [Pancytospora philotis]
MSTKINVYDVDGTTVLRTLEKPDVFNVELRDDLVQSVHGLTMLNQRQPYAVSPLAGKQHSAESWGTGRAMARVPRVKGSGTRRAGQAAFANFARKGRMAHPTKVTRRWNRKIPLTLRRTVCAMSIAATAIPEIVEGRGHRISKVNMLPIVVSNDISGISKTKEAVQMLNTLGLDEDLERVDKSRTITCGRGKMRNRRYNMKRGILLVHGGEELPAFANIQGVDTIKVDNLNVLTLAPGGKFGRLIVWTESAFTKLNALYGTIGGQSELKADYSLPEPIVSTDDLNEYFYSSEIQALIATPNLLPKGTCRRSAEDVSKTSEFVGLYNRIVN